MSVTNVGLVIVGAGHAGGSVAAFLRQEGYKSAITLIGAEAIPPYQRPPLSKAWLKGAAGMQTVLLRSENFYSDNNIALRLNTVAERIDRGAEHLVLADGERIPYEHLILATGARARTLRLPGGDLGGISSLRTIEDANRLRARLESGKRLVIIGGGYVGLEVAASARSLGADVVLIEREARLLPRVASDVLSTFFFEYHQRQGVQFILGAEAERFVGKDNRAQAVKLRDGTLVHADVFLVGVGAVPNQQLASEADLSCHDGILVDGQARTSDPKIFAIGDCTRRPVPIFNDRTLRLESVPSALEQARQVACALVGRAKHAPEVPWFWSDQYDIKLQIAGLLSRSAQVVVRGDIASEKFAVFHLDAACRVQAVEAINAPAEFMGARIMIGQQKPTEPKKLRDTSISMREMAA